MDFGAHLYGSVLSYIEKHGKLCVKSTHSQFSALDILIINGPYTEKVIMATHF